MPDDLSKSRLLTAIGYDDLADEARQRLLAEYPDSEAASMIRVNDEGS